MDAAVNHVKPNIAPAKAIGGQVKQQRVVKEAPKAAAHGKQPVNKADTRKDPKTEKVREAVKNKDEKAKKTGGAGGYVFGASRSSKI